MLLNKIAALSGWRAFGLSFLSGILLALGQAPFDFPWALFLAVPVLYLMLTHCSWRGGFWIGWAAGVGYFALALHWIVEPFLVDLARTGWMAPFALVLLAGGLALFWAIPFALFSRIGGGALAFAGLWTLSEFARSTVLTGFPWALIGYGWVEMPIMQGAAFVGSHGLGFVLLLIAALPVIWRAKGAGVAVIVMGVAWFGLGARISEVPLTDRVVRLIQPNAPQHLKWHPDHAATFWERQLASTAAEGAVDLIVWPESAVPYLLGTRPDLTAIMSQAAGAAKVIFGASRAQGEVWYNSAVVMGATGEIEALYDKHHLVPFGEFLPFPEIWDRFGLQGLARNAGRFSPGPGPLRVETDAVPSFQLLICYEAIFPAEILRGDERPDWLLHLTNDAWFGDFSGPFQHLAQARIRAIEFGLPLARAANTGVSAMIDPFGRIREKLDLNRDGHVDARLPAPLPPTLYARLGDIPVLGLIFVLLGLGVALERRKKPNLADSG